MNSLRLTPLFVVGFFVAAASPALAQKPERTISDVSAGFGFGVGATTTLKVGFSKGVIWEQLALPLFSSRNRIVNLSNSASVFLGNQIIYMHDAAVFDTPAHFSRLFRAWYRVMFWILARTSLCVLTNSRFSRDRLAHHCGVSTKKISVVPLGADHLDALEPDASILKTLSLTPGRFVLAA